ncbi:MAG: glucose-6-phosphate isomerase [Ruminococcus sp.]|jgi:glucose-6-phosphate isomerase|nr:glucose-6-phosphate isomerase [Ruminococcus sp.]
MIKLNTNYLKGFVADHEIAYAEDGVNAAAALLDSKNGPGNDFLGWTTLPFDLTTNPEYVKEIELIKDSAKIIKKSSALLVIGIGGSYLGARAVIDLLKSPLYNNLKKDTPDIYYIGNSINPAYLNEVLSIIEDRDICINVISKSGTTTEPALAFRIIREKMIAKYGKDGVRDRIFCTTDKARGTLKKLADEEGYRTFVVPDDVGGRFSVLTAVGLLPMACAGIDIDAVIAGAQKAVEDTVLPYASNDCYKYAAVRNILYRKGKSVELMVSYDPAYAMMSEWFKQLFGESEGKDGKGLFPASVTFSTDLHSLGQFVQDGSNIMFETVIDIKTPKTDIFLENDKDNIDGLNFLTGQNMSMVNRKAFEGTVLAHTEGGVPNIIIEMDKIDEENVGYLIYFFEKACAVSGYMLGVNPFDQPGVEGYKNNMYALLGKPGYEEKRAELEKKLG